MKINSRKINGKVAAQNKLIYVFLPKKTSRCWIHVNSSITRSLFPCQAKIFVFQNWERWVTENCVLLSRFGLNCAPTERTFDKPFYLFIFLVAKAQLTVDFTTHHISWVFRPKVYFFSCLGKLFFFSETKGRERSCCTYSIDRTLLLGGHLPSSPILSPRSPTEKKGEGTLHKRQLDWSGGGHFSRIWFLSTRMVHTAFSFLWRHTKTILSSCLCSRDLNIG